MRQPRNRLLLALSVGLFWPTALLRADEPPVEAPAAHAAPQENEASLPPERVAKLISDLESPDFATRQQASRELARAGAAAIEPLAQAALQGDLEVTSRALEALNSIYNRGDDATLDAVEDALERLAESGKAATASRARTVLELNSDIRERRAIAEIERLGGRISYGDAHFDPTDPDGIRPTIEHILLGRSWKGGDEGLKYIQRLPNLLALYVVRSPKISPISEQAQQELAAAMPQLRIETRGAACLGVKGPHGGNNLGGVQILSVEPGSAADRGGLHEWDIITSFGGKPAASFKQLVDLIAEHEPGEQVKVEVVRGSRTLTLDVVMGDWESLPSHRRTPPPQPPDAP